MLAFGGEDGEAVDADEEVAVVAGCGAVGAVCVVVDAVVVVDVGVVFDDESVVTNSRWESRSRARSVGFMLVPAVAM